MGFSVIHKMMTDLESRAQDITYALQMCIKVLEKSELVEEIKMVGDFLEMRSRIRRMVLTHKAADMTNPANVQTLLRDLNYIRKLHNEMSNCITESNLTIDLPSNSNTDKTND